MLKRFSRLKVKGLDLCLVQMYECFSGLCIHFDGVVSMLTCSDHSEVVAVQCTIHS